MYVCPNFIKNKVMGKIKILRLTDTERFVLKDGFCSGNFHCFCMLYFLNRKVFKSSLDIDLQTDMSHISVNSWVKRFEEFGIDGLSTRPGRGHKSIMDCSDEQIVHKAIEQDRQSVSKAREAWLNATGK